MKQIKANDNEYKDIFEKIVKPPKQLYIEGNEKLLKEKCIAIIGARNCTEEGFEIAREFSRHLASKGICIVSGMAVGIDTAAHLGALDVGGKTIAVLGCGLSNIYPKENSELYKKIINAGGAVITEYRQNANPCSKRFVERNRIVSGLSIGVLVIEAAYRSGTSITAGIALSQKRSVFCIPHNINEKYGVGTNKLLKRGAKLVTDPEEIIEQCKELEEYKLIKKSIKPKEIITIKKVKEEYKEIYNLLLKESLNINIISLKLNKNINEINTKLTLMELEGFVEQLPGKKFKVIN